jgi:ADP-ribosyl-[dinitrogen reductase] hydrolase
MMYDAVFDKALASYLGFACGDALGATVEFLSARQIQKRYGIFKDIIGGGWLGLASGQVTDDTQMALAVGKAIIDEQTLDARAVADNFVRWLENDPPDIGNTCRRSILRYRDQNILFGPLRDDDAGNGACMRNLPVVLATLNHPENFDSWTLQQCHITHHNPLSDAAALCLGRMVKQLIQGDEQSCLQETRRLITQHPEFSYAPYPGKASPYIVHTLQTVFHYFFSTDEFESCLVGTVNQGEDADTTGALAGMLAGAKYGLSAIPERWLSALNEEVSKEIHLQTSALIQLNKG